MNAPQHYKYFTYEEFQSPDIPGSGVLMEPTFLMMLDSARGMAAIPFKITSGYRSRNHNEAVGGSPTSSHLKGLAVDIAYNSERDAVRIIACLSRAGFVRIGKGDGFIHVDLDHDKVHPAYWDYG
jgi:zinc D-Ala-D-Ala carboxypeptidase